MSNLLKGEKQEGFIIEPFDAEEFPVSMEYSSIGKDGKVTLPIGEKKVLNSASIGNGEVRDNQSRIEKEAYEKGFEQGQKDGMALGKKRLEQTVNEMNSLLEGFSRLKGQIYAEAEQELLTLSMEIAKKIVKSELNTDPSIIMRAIRSATAFLAEGSQMRILICPDDMKEVEKCLPSLAAETGKEQFELIEDRSVERGGCVLETGFGKINCTVKEQMSVLEKEFEAIFLSQKDEISDT